MTAFQLDAYRPPSVGGGGGTALEGGKVLEGTAGGGGLV